MYIPNKPKSGKKKSRAIKLLLPTVLSTMLLSACGDMSPQEDPQRDVYANKQECVQDWGEDGLCETATDDDVREYQQQHPGVLIYPYYMFGPSYYSGDRTVSYQGRTISPATRSSSLAPVGVRSGTSLAARPSFSSPRSTSFGGFGGRGGSTGG